MSCITKLLEIKGDREILPIHKRAVIEGGGNYKGFEYLVTFTQYGTRCGYVAIPDGFRGDYTDIDCHGGVTFSERDHGAKDLLPIACNDLWIGFDCAHWGDMRDLETSKKYFPEDMAIEMYQELHKEIHEMEKQDPHFSHKTYDYVEKECQSIIDQLLGSEHASTQNI